MLKLSNLKYISKGFSNYSLGITLKKSIFKKPHEILGSEQYEDIDYSDRTFTKNEKEGEPDYFTNPVKSKVFKYNRYITPTLRTVKQPQTEEEIAEKFNRKADYKDDFILDANSVDDYFVVGAEIFKNYYKDQCKAGKGIETALKGFQVIEDNALIKEHRKFKTEEYGPIKENLYYEDNRTEKDKFYGSRAYIDVVAHEKHRHIFVPSYREKKSNFDAIKALKPNYIVNSSGEDANRDDFNLQLLEKIAVAPAFNFLNNKNEKKNNLTFGFIEIYNANLDNLITELKDIFESSKKNFIYPENPSFMFSNDRISRCFTDNSYAENSKYMSPEDSIKFNEVIILEDLGLL